MLFKKKTNLTKKDIINKVNFQLKNNFFSLAEIRTLKLRSVRKIIKLIAKVEKIKLSRQEIKVISVFLLSDFSDHKKISTVEKMWNFVKDFSQPQKIKQQKNYYQFLSLIFLTNYRYRKYDLMRI